MAPKQAFRALLAVFKVSSACKRQIEGEEERACREGLKKKMEKSAEVAQNVNVNK